MHILVTNDDGVTSHGLLALAQELRKLGQVTVCAPDRNWSASGHVKTLERPLRVHEVHLEDGSPAFSTDGAPSDCVAMPLMGLVEDKIDLVMAGIFFITIGVAAGLLTLAWILPGPVGIFLRLPVVNVLILVSVVVSMLATVVVGVFFQGY